MGLETIALVGAGISAATTVAGTAMSASAANAEGKAAANSAAYRAQVARNNQILAKQNAAASARDAARAETDASKVGQAVQERGQQQDRSARQEIADVVATQGASGLRGVSQTGVVSTLRALAAQDRVNLRKQGEAEVAQAQDRVIGFQQDAINFENQAKGLGDQANVELAQGRYAKSAANAAAVGALVQGAGQLGSTVITSAGNPMVKSWFDKRGRGGGFKSAPWAEMWTP